MAIRPQDGLTAALSDQVDEQHLAEQCCAELGLGPPSAVGRVSMGRSGSLVLTALVGSEEVVIKVTTDPARFARAELEARLLSDSVGQFGQVMPRLVASGSSDGWVAIVTQRGTPLAGPPQLTREQWVDLAAALAMLHQPPKVSVGLGVETRSVWASAGLHDRELDTWAALGSGRDAARGVELLTSGPVSDLPSVLTHGDCHTENVVRDPTGSYRWIDWQEAHLGDGLADLVFLWQRAEFARACPPRPEMVEVYARARHVSVSRLQPLLDLAELQSLLHSWPPFLGFGGPAAQDVMRRRLHALVTR